MAASGSRIPSSRIPHTPGLFKRPNENDEITTDVKRPKFNACAKPSASRGLMRAHSNIALNSGGFSESAKKRAVLQPQKSANNVRESAPALRNNLTSTLSSTGLQKSTRPKWDLKGRMEDMERYNLQLMDRVETFTKRIIALEKDKTELDRDVKVKSELSQEASAKIEKLEKELCEMTRKSQELETTVKERDAKIKQLESQITSLTSENALLTSEKSSLQSLVTTLTSSQCTVQTELNATKLILLQKQRELENRDNTIAKMQKEIDGLEEKMQEDERTRRQLHNMVQELKGNIRVFCRIRPSLPKEIKDRIVMSNINLQPGNKTMEISHAVSESEALSKQRQSYEFSFDHVFNQSAGQDEVFSEISQLVQSALDGFHVCIFAYGQTGSGKTYTMEGPEDIFDFVVASDDSRLGMIPRSIHQIFQSACELKRKGWTYKMDASFIEIYNEQIRDMLVDNNNPSAPKCSIKRTANKGNEGYISNVSTTTVTSVEQVYELLHKARANRAVAATNCNERSSRSHYIFQMKLYGENEVTQEKCEGILNLVDLAGSERIKESGSAGDRFTEAKNINKSLSNLGNVIMALSQKAEHVPYRNSKLTHLLMHSLGGSAKTLMFVNISPCEDHFNESVNSLRFATKVNQCNIGTAQKRVKP